MKAKRKGNSFQPSSHPPERGRAWDNGFDEERDSGHSGRLSTAQPSPFKPVASGSSRNVLSGIRFHKKTSPSLKNVPSSSPYGQGPTTTGCEAIFKAALNGVKTSANTTSKKPMEQITSQSIRGLANHSKGKGKANDSIDLTGDVERTAPTDRHIEEEIQMFSDDSRSAHGRSLNVHRSQRHNSGGDSDDPMLLPAAKPPKEQSMKRKDGTVNDLYSTSNSKPKPKPKGRHEVEALHTVRLRTVQFNKKAHAAQSGGIFCLNLSDTFPHCYLKLFDRKLELKLEVSTTSAFMIEASEVLQTSWRADRMLELLIKVSPGFHFKEDLKTWQRVWTDAPEHLRGRESPSENIFLFELDLSSPSNTAQDIHRVVKDWPRDVSAMHSDDLWETFPLPPLSSDHCDEKRIHKISTQPMSSSERARRQDHFLQEGTLDFEVSTSTYRSPVPRQTRDQVPQAAANGKDLKTLALETLDQNGLKLLDRTAAESNEARKRQQLLHPEPSDKLSSSRHPVQPNDRPPVNDSSTPKRLGSSRLQHPHRDGPLPHNTCTTYKSLASCNSLSRYATRNSRYAEDPIRSPVEDLPVHKPRALSNGSCDSDIALVWPFDDERTLSSVAITNGDLKRLEEGEFLNDTLIEFGLKWELSEIRRMDSDLADSIHLFNSFFYQKLSGKSRQKSNLTEEAKKAYEGVRKWTKGLDVFKKDFLVIPINEHMHWYFMIVTNPGKALDLPRELPPSDFQSPYTVKRMLRSRKSDSDVADKRASATPEPEPEQTATNSRFFPEGHDKAKEDVEMDDLTEAGPEEPGEPSNMVDKSTEAMQHMELDDNQGGELGVVPAPNEVDDMDLPYVLTLDSLGSSHRVQSQTVLRYLANEAEDKLSKTLPEASLFKAVSVRKVPVPEQPNFCDCGLYLIHAFKTFFHDRTRMLRWILNNHKRRPNEHMQAEIKETWDAAGAAQARKALRERINLLIPQYQEHAKQQKALTAERKREHANIRKLSATALAVGEESTKKRRLSHNDCTDLSDPTAKVNGGSSGPIPSRQLRATAPNSPCLVEDEGSPTSLEDTSVTLRPRTSVAFGRQMGDTASLLDDSGGIPGPIRTPNCHSRRASVEGVGTPEEQSPLDSLQNEDMYRMLNHSTPVPIAQREISVQSQGTIGSQTEDTQRLALPSDDLSSLSPLPANGKSCQSSRKGVNGDVSHDIFSDVDGEPMEQEEDVQELSVEEQTHPVRTPIEILTPQARLSSPEPTCKGKTRSETRAQNSTYASVAQARPASTSKGRRSSGRLAPVGQTSSDSRPTGIRQPEFTKPTTELKRKLAGAKSGGGDQDNPLTVDDD